MVAQIGLPVSGLVTNLSSIDGSVTLRNPEGQIIDLAVNPTGPTNGVYNVDTYGADPTGATSSNAAFTAAMAALNTTGGSLYCPGIYQLSTPLIVSHDNVRIRGNVEGTSRINYTGGGACISTDPTAIRRNGGIENLFISCLTAGATALKLDNAYRWVSLESTFQSQNGTTGIGIDLVGSLAKSTYFNQFIACDSWGSLASVRMGDNVNGNQFIGGVLEGPGYSVQMTTAIANMGTNLFRGVAIQSEGTNTGGVIIQLGTPASANQCSYNTLSDCRIETAGATTIKVEANAWYNAIIGGSISNTVTVVDSSTPIQTNLIQIQAGLTKSPLLKTLSVITGLRPSAVTYGTGAQIYDSTLSKPIWSDGTVWRDAAGTAV